MNKKESKLDTIECPECRGTGQDNPPPGKYHGLCPRCKGKGIIERVD